MGTLRRAGLGAAALGLTAIWVASCLPTPEAFECNSNPECEPLGGGARCDLPGRCSIGDDSCDSGRRYHKSAGSLGGQCVTATPGVDASPGDGSVPRGSIAAIGGGFNTFCAVTIEGNVWCWGDAIDTPENELPDNPSPVLVRVSSGAPLAGAIEVDIGEYHACALLEDNTVACWGRNFHGQLGKGVDAREHAEVVPDLDQIDEIAVAGGHSCARRGGELYCWGRNATAELGDGTTTPRTQPKRFGSISAAIRAGVGRYHTCVILEDTRILCAGRNNRSQLGTGEATDIEANPVPVVVDGSDTPLTGASDVIGGTNHTCAVVGDDVRCWGTDDDGETGRSSPGVTAFPSVVDKGEAPDCIPLQVATRNANACARCDNGKVACWGRGDKGRLGDGSLTGRTSMGYALVPGSVTDLAASASAACALAAGNVYCWGGDGNGELGNGLPYGGEEYSATPVEVPFP